jgi:hypothetical protein
MKALNAKVIILLLSFIALLLCSSHLHANQDKVYKIGVENIDYYPHYAFGHHKNSFIKELLESFFKSNNIKYEFVPLPLKRFNQWYLKDSIDFKYPDNAMWRTGESKSLPIIYSSSVIKSTAGSVVLNTNLSRKRDQIERLGTITRFSPVLWQDKVDDNKVKVLNDSAVLSVIKMAIHGLVDVINLDYSVVNYHLNNLNKNKQLLMNPNLANQKINFHLSTIKHKKIILKFNDFLKSNKKLVENLKDKYQIIEDPFDLNTF